MKKQPTETTVTKAAAIVAAAAGLATSTVSAAATEATNTLAAAAAKALDTLEVAAGKALHMVELAAAKAVAEFPNLQEDMRAIHASQATQTSTIVDVVTKLIESHTVAEEGRLQSISDSVGSIEKHLVKQNGRLEKAETHITRQNLVIFGIAGPVALLIVGYLVHALVTLLKAGGWRWF